MQVVKAEWARQKIISLALSPYAKHVEEAVFQLAVSYEDIFFCVFPVTSSQDSVAARGNIGIVMLWVTGEQRIPLS